MMPDGWTPCCVKQNIQLTKYKILRRSISMIMIADDEITYFLKKKKEKSIFQYTYIRIYIYIYIYLCLMIIIEKKEKKRGERIIKALSV